MKKDRLKSALIETQKVLLEAMAEVQIEFDNTKDVFKRLRCSNVLRNLKCAMDDVRRAF